MPCACGSLPSARLWTIHYFEAHVCTLQSKLDKSGPPKADEVVRAYDGLIGHVKELSETAARLGGSAGETLLEECTAQVSPLGLLPCMWPWPMPISIQRALPCNLHPGKTHGSA